MANENKQNLGRFLQALGTGMSGFAAPFTGNKNWQPPKSQEPTREELLQLALLERLVGDRMPQSGGTINQVPPSDIAGTEVVRPDGANVGLPSGYAPIRPDAIDPMFGTMGKKLGGQSRQNEFLQDLDKKAAEVSIASEQKAKEKNLLDIQSAQKQARGTYRAMQQYGRARKELIKFDPNIEKEGFSGWWTRRGAEVANYFDVLPETQAMQIMIKPIANGMARDIEGGRVTDKDREIYEAAFANALQNPTTTNIRLMSNAFVDALDKGASKSVVPMLKQLISSDDDIFGQVAAQIFNEFPEMVEEVYGKGAKVVE